MHKFCWLFFIIALKSFATEDLKILNHESSLSIVQTGGNAISESYSASTDNSYKPSIRDYQFFGNYNLAYANNPRVQNSEIKETVRNWNIGSKLTQDFLLKGLGVGIGLTYEGNEFAGIKQRENSDFNARYKFHNSDKLKSSIEIGYRYTEEKRTIRDENNRDIFYFSKGNFRYNITQKINHNVNYRFWIQYLPNFSRPQNYQINLEPSINVTMTQIFSLRVAYKAEYNGEPNFPGGEYLDHVTTTSLVAKY